MSNFGKMLPQLGDRVTPRKLHHGGLTSARPGLVSVLLRLIHLLKPIGLLLVLVATLTYTGVIGFRRRDIVSNA